MGKQVSITSFFGGKAPKKTQVNVCDLTLDPIPNDDTNGTFGDTKTSCILKEKSSTTRRSEAETARLRAAWQKKVLGDDMGQATDLIKKRPKTQEEVQNILTSSGLERKYTPLERQIVEFQAQYHPTGCVLAIEVGYKYKFFGVDAEIASRVLGVFSYPERSFLTASVPTVNMQHHIRKLVAAGYKVGIVSQVETAAIKASSASSGSKLFKRELTQMYTSATIDAIQPETMTGKLDILDSKNQHYLVCVIEDRNKSQHGKISIGVVAVECSTGQILQARFVDGDMRLRLESCLLVTRPVEILLADNLSTNTKRMLTAYCQGTETRVSDVDGSKYATGGASSAIHGYLKPAVDNGELENSKQALTLHRVMDLDALVIQGLAHCLEYLDSFGLGQVIRTSGQIQSFSQINEITLSSNSIQQLEILTNSDDGREYGSLIWLLDQTKTKFGSRLMRKWVTAPLKRGSDILKRLEAVEAIIQMIDTPSIITSVIKLLEDLSIDLERCLGRISHKTICPRDLISCLAAFRDICKVLNGDSGTVDGKTFLDSIKSDFLQHLLQDCTDQKAAKFANNVIASLNIQACEENDIINVYNDDMKYSSVAQRRKQLEDSKVAIDNLRPSLAKDLGFSSVEYVSIQNQGEYLIEVPISKENLVPPSWEKISSTKQMMRFLPPTVAEHIQQVDLAREYLGIVANESWKDLLEDVGMYLHEFHNIVKALSSLDCLISFAALSRRQGYVKPKIIDDDLAEPFYEVRDGRHPILEVTNNEHRFVPNDVHLGGRRAICQVITGPNMGGKSVYIKQGALIAFMAQIGCFVPASYCALRPFDAIFTRMGAADSIALGRSTFLEEVSEASQILVDASARSLVIIDELGRGTSSQDGQSIALATIKHLISVVGCAILFVTHYPEIAIESCSSRLIMERACPYFMGYITDTEESKIIFTYKLTEGVADSSYGLNVAHMAGVPENVTEKAESIASYIHKQIQSSSSKAMFRKLMRILNERETLSKENILDLQRQVQSRI